LRIISGKYKGRVIHPPKNFRARPTTDFARESLFNILSHTIDFEDLIVLDLFSGTGSIAIEFASRGAKEVVAVEKNFIHHQFIKKAIDQIKAENISAIKTDAFTYIARMKKSFDIIFADPPYDLPKFDEVAEKVLNSSLLAPEAIFILEHSKEKDYSAYSEFFDQRKYGSVNFSMFKKDK
jgi:16S rRNA (guanine966-N2)-methyltransferase